jgi:hypothetical protein
MTKLAIAAILVACPSGPRRRDPSLPTFRQTTSCRGVSVGVSRSVGRHIPIIVIRGSQAYVIAKANTCAREHGELCDPSRRAKARRAPLADHVGKKIQPARLKK